VTFFCTFHCQSGGGGAGGSGTGGLGTGFITGVGGGDGGLGASTGITLARTVPFPLIK
jgi:hypothetical protein